MTRAVYFAPPAYSCTDDCPLITCSLVTTMSGRTKKPVPRALPASIDATAGRAALTRSSIDSDAGAGAVASAGAFAGRVSTMLPVTGATNALDASATGSGGPDEARPPADSWCGDTPTATGAISTD